MHLIYFDETKFEKTNPYFYIGGIIFDASLAREYETDLARIQYNFFGSQALTTETEVHAEFAYNGKGHFRGRKLAERIKLLDDVVTATISRPIQIRLIRIDVNAHRAKYRYPEPEYRLGLMLMLERVCDFLDKQNDDGLVFGDFEKDEVTKAILDFSQYKSDKTYHYRGRPLGRLIDTIYFTQSHHSRFLQVADVVCYLANRYMNPKHQPQKWHDLEGKKIWDKLKAQRITLQCWPEGKTIARD